MKRHHLRRMHRPLFALVLAVPIVGCGSDGDDADTEETTTEAVATTEAAPTTTDTVATTEPPDESMDEEAAIEAFCEKNEEILAVRGPVYNQPFTETPEEVEAMLAEAAVLQEELDALVPDEIRAEHDLHMTRFNEPIDALTEELGWDPYAAINTEEAAAIFADPEINAATEVLTAFLVEHCGFELPSGADSG